MSIAVALAMAVVMAATPAGAAAGGNSANAQLCQQDGWKTLYRADGSTFASQGDCVSYGAKGNTVRTEPPNAWKAACEQAGGTFSVSNTDAFEVPLTPPRFAYLCTSVSSAIWLDVLFPICLAYPDYANFGSWRASTATGDCVRNGPPSVSIRLADS